MFRNYFITAYRNLLRHKSYAAINIAGLAVGMAAGLLIFLVIHFETSFDTYRPDMQRIYRVVSAAQRAEGMQYSGAVQAPIGPALRAELPGVGIAAEVYGDYHDQVSLPADAQSPLGKKFMEGRVFFTEPQFFDIFPTTWLAGNARVLQDPHSAVLSEAKAAVYFGSWQNAVGKTITVDNKNLFTVRGIVSNPPANTDFPMEVMVSYYIQPQWALTSWTNVNSGFYAFIKLPAGADAAKAEAQVNAFGERHRDVHDEEMGLRLQPLSDMHYNTRYGNDYSHTFSRQLINALVLIGVFLLCIAAVNFINLATAQAVNRAREIGVRKALGSDRWMLIRQFLSETFVITACAAIVAVGLAFMALPLLNSLLQTPLDAQLLFHPAALSCLAALTVLVTLLSGLYPTLVLSGFDAVVALKSRISMKTVGGLRLRGALVVFQFVIAQLLIIGMLVVVKQMNFYNSEDLGFNKHNILLAKVPSDSSHAVARLALQQRLLAGSGVVNASLCFSAPADYNNWGSGFELAGSSHRRNDFGVGMKWSDSNYFSLFNLKMLAGRPYRNTTTGNEFVVNEQTIKKLGLKHPEDILGHEMSFNDGADHGPVVGVVKDYNINSLREPLAPVVMMSSQRKHEQSIAVQIKAKDMAATLAFIQKNYEAVFPQDMFEYEFLDRRIANFYADEARLSKLYGIFAAIAIFISCLGLYGLVSFMAVQRNKEVGIRKVLGANVAQIVLLFFKEFALLISIAFVIAAPMAYVGLQQWLNTFSYRIGLGPGIFLLTIGASMVFAWITVSYQSIRAATANPVKTLRSE